MCSSAIPARGALFTGLSAGPLRKSTPSLPHGSTHGKESEDCGTFQEYQMGGDSSTLRNKISKGRNGSACKRAFQQPPSAPRPDCLIGLGERPADIGHTRAALHCAARLWQGRRRWRAIRGVFEVQLRQGKANFAVQLHLQRCSAQQLDLIATCQQHADHARRRAGAAANQRALTPIGSRADNGSRGTWPGNGGDILALA